MYYLKKRKIVAIKSRKDELKIVSTQVYLDVNILKYKIYKENKDRSGIYCWTNKTTGSLYIGSSSNLTKRFIGYFSPRYLERELLRNNSRINNSLLKYGYDLFSLEILEYCEKDQLIVREQYYIDLLLPEYNILKIANSRLGLKHSPETLLKFKDRKLSPEAIVNLKKAMKGKAPSPLAKVNHLLATSHSVTIYNKENNLIKEYSSIREAARALNTSHNLILYYLKKNKVYKNIYLIKKNVKSKIN